MVIGTKTATSSSATYSWSFTTAVESARRPAADTTAMGAGLCARGSDVSSTANRTAVTARTRKTFMIRPGCRLFEAVLFLECRPGRFHPEKLFDGFAPEERVGGAFERHRRGRPHPVIVPGPDRGGIRHR